MPRSPASLDYFRDSYEARIAQLEEERAAGRKVLGTFCLYVPDEIIFASGADRVALCGGSADTIPLAEQVLPRNLCPLVRSSFGAIVDACCGGTLACPHVGLVDAIVGEATCDGKKKMYELLPASLPHHVLDLPQRPESPEALAYFTSELKRFGRFLEGLTGHFPSEDELAREIRAANETRRLLHRLYGLRTRDPPPIRGTEVLRVMQKQLFLSPEQFRQGVARLIGELERTGPGAREGPRILIAGCPMASGSTKVPEIIEERGAVIVAEESCTGTRSFRDLVDEERDPWEALAERYLGITCACMTPNDRRIARIIELAKEYHADGVIHYTLQFCHGYNIEGVRVRQALKGEHIPVLAIESDYGDADREQLGIRVDAFLEMIG
jgi:benzoyl-CoA reductase/2-hydroxyglutaryl-CoA dehydratase subunit BcrC/BadD/HgdB